MGLITGLKKKRFNINQIVVLIQIFELTRFFKHQNVVKIEFTSIQGRLISRGTLFTGR